MPETSSQTRLLFGSAVLLTILIILMLVYALQPVAPPVHPSMISANCAPTESGSSATPLIVALVLILGIVVAGVFFMRSRTQMIKANTAQIRATNRAQVAGPQNHPRVGTQQPYPFSQHNRQRGAY